jgi:hypothetical protein
MRARLLISTALLTGAAAGWLSTPVQAGESWFRSFERILVAPGIDRDSVTQLVDGGTVETDGFSERVFSFGGEFKEAIPQGGRLALRLP